MAIFVGQYFSAGPLVNTSCALGGGRRFDRSTPFGSFSYLEAFGLGRDPRSDAYKVIHFFHATAFAPLCVEVFTIGNTDRCWHDTVAQPPLHVKRRRAATFYKGSLIWTVDQMNSDGQLGFLRFSLGDETFSLIPPPPCWSWDNHEASTLSEMHEELCLTTIVVLMNRSLDMWICTDLDMPQCEKCYNILYDWTQPLRLLAVLGDGVLVCRSIQCG